MKTNKQMTTYISNRILFIPLPNQIIHCPQCAMGYCKETNGGYLQCQCFQLQCLKSKNKLKNISTLGRTNHIEI